MIEDSLPFDLDETGHLSEEAIVACADGQLDLVTPLVLQHLDGCAACGDHVSNAAELSFRFDLALAPEAEELATALAPASRGVPRAALAAALLLAVVGILPSALGSAWSVNLRPLWQATQVTLRSLPQLMNSVRAENPLGSLAPFLLAVLLMAIGTAIALRQTIATRNQNA
ncbi:MAG: hypothetical protein H6718_02705 [Polyangiaceae bacterium]|nr:hypothetical protein [Myxococcales bacterium]MCB9584276.1 hypothetical protein [Polyangiaceae bacterium]MCB9608561.1 hypothetical protein [Polyangiaceae bacterium]